MKESWPAYDEQCHVNYPGVFLEWKRNGGI